MTKTEYLQLLAAARQEWNKEGTLKESTKELLLKEKDSVSLTEIERADLYKLLQMTGTAKMNAASSNNAIRFGGRGPRNFGTGEKAKNRKGTILRLLKYFKKEIGLVGILFSAILIVVLCHVITP
ncbi:MAG: hypothetical protein K2K15_01885, partial [Anaeroplasmataceae bacterium]|nr:hypothetical protein [Anaeroplasmataceae bacterium]